MSEGSPADMIMTNREQWDRHNTEDRGRAATIARFRAELAAAHAENEHLRIRLDAQLPQGSCGLRLESGFWECNELTVLRAALAAALATVKEA